ncbi:sigma factor-binding protein Crl [Vibrio rumoiensis]|uniref:Sigma factor-binding protein Crl n=1 Tax=Vibrio rumoiensis 1S-45 TaxID=1188252 RepID=A0A1E5E3B0_9VIBR|nr:sigma factor-binding protein Crl [Vibrio rumoiensis]OEF26285.1 sigma factor-binding protein Crl [Vibrio rumoiensis 1S-45]
MMTDASAPTHYRLMTSLKAIGPYLREGECQAGKYWFDCLSVCVDDKKSPELREFWGWWLQLEKVEDNFIANYTLGQYDEKGDWLDVTMSAKAKAEVERTLEEFHQKLVNVLSGNYSYSVSLHKNSVGTV